MKKYKYESQWHANDILKEGPFTSTKDAFERVASFFPDRKVLAILDEDKKIKYWTAKEFKEETYAVGDGLIDLGLEGQHICICGDNSFEYVLCDTAIAAGVGVVTPLDKDAPVELLVRLLTKAEITAAIVSSYLLQKFEDVKKIYPALTTIITMDKRIEGYPYLEDIKEKGFKLASKKYYENKKIDPNALAKLLFTSGTTGSNKAVMLSQSNLANNIMNCMDIILGTNDETNTSMSVLPMHHATEINSHVFSRLASGRLTYICTSMKTMMQDIKIFKPYCITIVPMIANMFYKTIWDNARKAGMEKKLKMGIKLVTALRKIGIDISHKLFKDLFVNFGGNLSQIVCGGAMLNPEVVRGLEQLGIFTSNGYGITEAGPVISMNNDTFNKPYSVGKCCPRNTAKLFNIDEDGVGELCVKGNSISLGYYKDPENTAKVFDKDGYFHTGDLARIDKKGFIFLVGRKINAIVLENGQNISPEEIENMIQDNIPYCEDICVYSVKKKVGNRLVEQLVAGLYIPDETIRHDHEKILNDFKAFNATLVPYKRINYVNLPEEEYEKTALKKVIRVKVMDKHNDKTGVTVF